MVEQDHRGIKNITKYMLGFKSFESAEATIAGIELHRMLKKDSWRMLGKCQPGSSSMRLLHNYVLNKADLNIINYFRQNHISYML